MAAGVHCRKKPVFVSLSSIWLRGIETGAIGVVAVSSVSPDSTFDSLSDEIGAVVEQEDRSSGEDCRIRLWDCNQKVEKFLLIENLSTGTEKIIGIKYFIGTSCGVL